MQNNSKISGRWVTENIHFPTWCWEGESIKCHKYLEGFDNKMKSFHDRDQLEIVGTKHQYTGFCKQREHIF